MKRNAKEKQFDARNYIIIKDIIKNMNVIRSKSINIHSSLWKNSKIIVKKKLNYKQMVDFRFEIRCDTSLYID